MEDYKDLLENLNEQEKQEVLKILDEYNRNGESNSLIKLYEEDYYEKPVDVETFINSEEYAGWFTNNGKDIYPFWKNHLKKIFESEESYSEIAITGGIGTGKSHIAVLALAYALYRLMCLKDPHSYYNIAKGGYIYVVFFNATLQLSQGVAYTKFQSLLQNSPWFMERGKVTGLKNLEYVPNGPIRFTVGSQMEHSIGKDILLGLLDEVNFVKGADVQMEKSKIMALYNCLNGDTVVRTANGNEKISNLQGHNIKVFTQTNKYIVEDSEIVTAMQTTKTNKLISIELEDGTVLKVTPEHKLRLSNGEYKEAQYLTSDDILMEEINESNIFELNIWEQFDIKDRERLTLYIAFMKEKYLNPADSDLIEYHHIMPKSFMENSFVIPLTPKEHFTAHKMLVNCFSGKYNTKVAYAFSLMCSGRHSNKYGVTQEDYEQSVRLKRLCESPLKGKKVSEEAKQHMKENHADFSGKNHWTYKYRKNGIKNPQCDAIYVNKDGIAKRVHGKEELDYYINELGYNQGFSPDFLEKLKTVNIGRVHINKNGKEKFVKMEDLDFYLNDGWKLGTLRDINGENNPNYNKVVVNREGIIRFVTKEEAEFLISDGYKLGTGIDAYNKNTVCVNNGESNKFVSETNLEYYLDSGWKLGMVRDLPNRFGYVPVTNIETQETKYININTEEIPNGFVRGFSNSVQKKHCKWIYIYDNIEFYGREKILTYLRENGYPKISSCALNKLAGFKTVRGYETLLGRITRREIQNENTIS